MNIETLRRDFPILSQTIGSHPLVYLDNAATTQLPSCTIEALKHHYSCDNANVHRGIHTLSERSTSLLEQTRSAVAAFLGAGSADNIVFTTGVTGSINLAALSYLAPVLDQGDNVVVSVYEHHSNYLPYEALCRKHGADLRIFRPDRQRPEDVIDGRTRLVAVTHVSNVTGYLMPLEEVISAAHRLDVPVLVDGAQAAKELPIDVQALDADFYAISAHKIFAPGGSGALYVKSRYTKQMRPITPGGGMVSGFTSEGAPVYESFPLCLEAGTPNIANLIAWKTSLDYLERLGKAELYRMERDISHYLYLRLKEVDEVRILGENPHHLGCVSFRIEGIHPFDLAALLDKKGIALRSGHHCAIPLHRALSCEASLRASTAFYNTTDEVDYFIRQLKHVIVLLRES